MPTVEESVIIPAAQADLFDLAQDYALRLRWDPFLSRLEFRDGATQATVGTRVWVRAKNGLAMEVVFITLDRPRSVAMKMTSGPWFFQRFAGSWRFDALTPDSTRVTFRYGFETRLAPLRPLLDRIITAVFTRDIRARLLGLKRGAEDPALRAELQRTRQTNAALIP